MLKETRLQILELDKNFNRKITQIETDKKNELDELTFFESKDPINNKYNSIINSEKTAYENQKTSLQSEENQTKQRLVQDIEAANKSIELNKNKIIDLQNQIKPVGSFDNSQIQKINKNYQQKINTEEKKLQNLIKI